VITGFNTDIEYQGVTYHVQTEDKGLSTPLILSLVYNRGTILASKRSPYDDLLLDDFDEKILTERLQKQHKLICAAIRAGRIEDLKRMTMKESASKNKELVAQKEVPIEESKEKHIVHPKPENVEKVTDESKSDKLKTNKSEKITEKTSETKDEVVNVKKTDNVPVPNILIEKTEKSEEIELPKNLDKAEKIETEKVKIEKTKIEEIKSKSVEEKADVEIEEQVWDIPIDVIEEFIIEDVEVIEEPIKPSEAVAVITDFAKNDKVSEDQLQIELLNEKDYKGGERTTLNILVTRGKNEKSVMNADVMIKVLGSSFRPLIFHAKTDSNGVAIVHLQFPHFKTGRAALLIKVNSKSDEVELRRIIQQG
jgi:hypothetical protein